MQQGALWSERMDRLSCHKSLLLSLWNLKRIPVSFLGSQGSLAPATRQTMPLDWCLTPRGSWVYQNPPLSFQLGCHSGVCRRSCKQEAVWKLHKGKLWSGLEAWNQSSWPKSLCIHQSDSLSDPKLSPVDMSNLLDKKVSAPLLQFFLSWSHHVICCCSDVVFLNWHFVFSEHVHVRFRRIACAWLYI